MNFIYLFALLSLASAADLKIYIFEIGQADSQLIVFPSGYSILIDLGDRTSDAKHTKRIASRIESEIISQILSGCPSVTDSDVKSILLFSFILLSFRIYQKQRARGDSSRARRKTHLSGISTL